MKKNLVIVESPAKAKTIGNFLGKGFRVQSSFGHIRDLSKENYGVDIENNYLPEYIIPEDKKKIDETEKDLFELNRHKIPPRNKVLLSSMTLASKAKIIENMQRIENMSPHNSEYFKLDKWIGSILKVPFDKYYKLPISITSPNQEIQSYLSNIESVMDNSIFAQRIAKEKILEFVGKWITNPSSTNEPIAFVGEKGTGKTTLAKEGIAKALGRPFFMISLGGESDAASFKGHDYTYEGSQWGRIVDILISTQCMNPVIFFDELDKISSTQAGEEITGMLMHLTDTTQNDKFSDKYFSGIDFDLSKALFIFSYNDADKLNPILRDRLTEIQFTSFKKEDKLVIAKQFLIDKTCKNIGLKTNNFRLEDSTIIRLIEKYTPDEESGVRSLKRIIETLFLRINLFQLPQDLNISYKNMKFKLKDGKYEITDEIISKLLKDIAPCISTSTLSMYM
jgi:ATP-dependent Lon protease